MTPSFTAPMRPPSLFLLSSATALCPLHRWEKLRQEPTTSHWFSQVGFPPPPQLTLAPLLGFHRERGHEVVEVSRGQRWAPPPHPIVSHPGPNRGPALLCGIPRNPAWHHGVGVGGARTPHLPHSPGPEMRLALGQILTPAPQLDLGRPLSPQGPFDVILHKPSDLLLASDYDIHAQSLVDNFQVTPSTAQCGTGVPHPLSRWRPSSALRGPAPFRPSAAQFEPGRPPLAPGWRWGWSWGGCGWLWGGRQC